MSVYIGAEPHAWWDCLGEPGRVIGLGAVAREWFAEGVKDVRADKVYGFDAKLRWPSDRLAYYAYNNGRIHGARS